jgi:hypothetical protein
MMCGDCAELAAFVRLGFSGTCGVSDVSLLTPFNRVRTNVFFSAYILARVILTAHFQVAHLVGGAHTTMVKVNGKMLSGCVRCVRSGAEWCLAVGGGACSVSPAPTVLC